MTLQNKGKQSPAIVLLIDVTFLAFESSEGPSIFSIEFNFVVISLVVFSPQPVNIAINTVSTCVINRDSLSKQHHCLLSLLPHTPRSDPLINNIDIKKKRIQ